MSRLSDTRKKKSTGFWPTVLDRLCFSVSCFIMFWFMIHSVSWFMLSVSCFLFHNSCFTIPAYRIYLFVAREGTRTSWAAAKGHPGELEWPGWRLLGVFLSDSSECGEKAQQEKEMLLSTKTPQICESLDPWPLEGRLVIDFHPPHPSWVQACLTNW